MESFLTALASRRWFRLVLPLLIGIAVAGAYWQPLHLDLWNDEVYSLIRFQQVPVSTTLTDYHETNNHIFFNLLQNLYLRLIGSPSTLTILQQPAIARVLPLLYTALTYVLFYRWMKGMLGIPAALLACVLLTATLPFYNFALQYRAYSLVMMLATGWLYFFWLYLNDGKGSRLAVLAGCSMLIFYAHPAGVYLVVALSLGAMIAFAGSLMKPDRQRQRAIYAACATFTGAFAALLAYLPVITQLLANPWVSGHRIGLAQFLKDKFLSSTLQILCSRYWLLALMVGGLIWRIQQAKGGDRRSIFKLRWILFCCTTYVIAFLIPMLRHDDAPQRTFTMLIPVFIAGAVPALDALAGSAWAGRYHHTMILTICLILLIQVPLQIRHRNRAAKAFAAAGQENASLINAYYLHSFRPMDIAMLAAKESAASGLPVYFGNVYRQEMPHYFEALGQAYREYGTPAGQASAPDSFLIVTFFPAQFAREHEADIECRQVDTSPSFYHLLRVNRRR